MSISIHGPTNNGGFNVFGLKDQLFILQGNLTLAELKDLRDQCDATLKSHCTCITDQAGDGCNCQRKHPDSPVPCPACDCPVHGGDES